MDNEIKQKLLRLFEIRDKNWETDTGYILKFLEPTLQALYEFFGCSEENIQWLNVILTDDTVLLTSIITHRGEEKAPVLLTAIAPAIVKMDEEVRVVNRLVRVGIPMDVIMSPPEVIIEFLTARVKQQLEERGITMEDIETIAAEHETAQQVEQEFDPVTLTEDQKLSLLMNMHNVSGGVKH